MTDHFAFAFILLAWILIPLVAWLVYWLLKRFRGSKEEGEGEADG